MSRIIEFRKSAQKAEKQSVQGKTCALLAPGGISHSGPGENRQFWPDENSQS